MTNSLCILRLLKNYFLKSGLSAVHKRLVRLIFLVHSLLRLLSAKCSSSSAGYFLFVPVKGILAVRVYMPQSVYAILVPACLLPPLPRGGKGGLNWIVPLKWPNRSNDSRNNIANKLSCLNVCSKAK